MSLKPILLCKVHLQSYLDSSTEGDMQAVELDEELGGLIREHQVRFEESDRLTLLCSPYSRFGFVLFVDPKGRKKINWEQFAGLFSKHPVRYQGKWNTKEIQVLESLCPDLSSVETL